MATCSELTSNTDENWQCSKKTVKDRNAHMFNNPLMSDINFTVGKEASLQVNIPAHKYVLGVSSPVFYAMFFGEMAEEKREIRLPDCEAECFLEFLRFVYSDEIQLCAENVLGVLYLGRKYLVPSLVDACVEFLEENLDVENSFTILTQARSFGLKELEVQCWDIIDRETARCLETSGFTSIDKDTLMLLLRRETLTVREHLLFSALCRWADNQLMRQEKESTTEARRDILSEALDLIRYPCMSAEDFADEVVRSGLLSDKDIISLFMHFNSSVDSTTRFARAPRRGKLPLKERKHHRCSRFTDRQFTHGWNYIGDRMDCITFYTNKNITIHGVGLFGSNVTGQVYTVKVEFLRGNKELAVKELSFISNAQQVVHDVMLDKPLLLDKDTLCTVKAGLKGPPSFFGANGLSEVTCANVKFNFQSVRSPNGTTVNQGQFAEVIFSVV